MSELIETDQEEEQTWAIRPNKSQIKRDIAVLSELCEEITQLAPAQTTRLDLPENIELAILEAAKMPLKGARERQLKFINGLMRKIDVEPIQQKLDKIKAKSAHAARELHQLENWRERLLSDDKQGLTEFLMQYPEADVQHMRQLIRNAKKELALEKPPKSSRLLFRYIRGLLESRDSIEED